MELIKTNGSAEKICTLIHRVRPAAWRLDYPTDVDIEEIFHDPAMPERSLLWLGLDGDPCAYAFVHFPYNNLNLEAIEEYWTDAWEDEVAAWAVAQMRAQYGTDVVNQTLDGSCRSEDVRMTRFFRRHGFEKDGIESLTYELILSGLPALPVLPEGFSLRPLRPESELAEVVALHQAAHGTENFTLEERLAIMSTPEYLPGLDLVVVAPDGALAGNCICGVSGADGSEGFTDPVVVHPGYQRRGLARALILAGLVDLYRRGVRLVQFGTSSENTAMQRVAEVLGFICVARKTWYSKRLDL